MLSVNTSQGTEFWIAIPANELNPFPVDELELYITSEYDTDVQIHDAGGNKTISRKVSKGQITTLTNKGGASETNWNWEVREFESVVRKGIRITSAKPISVYVLNSKLTTTDGYLAIPTQAWGTDYIHCSYYDFIEFRPWAGGFIVVAKENGTQLSIDLRGVGENDGKTAGGKKINTGNVVIVTLDAGDVYMVKGDATTRGIFDLTGSRIRSSKPVGVVAFHERTTMPNLLVNGNGRNHLSEMLPPVQAWGKRYTTVEIKREHLNGVGSGDVFRVVASEPNTRWSLKYYNKTNKALVGQGGGTLLKAGQFADISQSASPTALTSGFSVWEADKPVLVMQYSCSQSWDGDPVMDPFMTLVTALEQFVTRAVFQLPTAAKFNSHRLNLIVWADSSDPNYINNLKSLAVDGVAVWNHPSSDTPALLSNRMPGGRGLHWVSLTLETSAKSHTITCNNKVRFGGYVNGYGAADCYGWPAAGAFRWTTSIDTMPPKIIRSPACGDFDYEATELRNIPNPPLVPPRDSDQVETGISEIDFVEGSGSTNYRIVLITSQSFPREPSFKQFRFRMEVVDKNMDAFAVIRITDFGTNTVDGNVNMVYDTVRYTAPKLTVSPSPLSFGKQRVGTMATLNATITNNETRPVEVSNISLLFNERYTIKAGAVPPVLTLQPGASHTVTLEYDASHDSTHAPIGKDIDTLRVSASCGDMLFGVSGFAVEPVIQVSDIHAAHTPVGEQSCSLLRIDNLGSDTLVVYDIKGYEGSTFKLSDPLQPPLPIVIAPNKIQNVEFVCYAPITESFSEIDVTFTSNAARGDSVSLWTGQTPVGVEHDEVTTGSILLHPQPTTDVLYVSSPRSLTFPINVRMINLRGETMRTSTQLETDSREFGLSVADLPSGRYTLLLTSMSGLYSTPVVIAR